ncbi:MAG: hypothetical protein KDA96_09065, partial [Planctomycetaceae bacterium]|nr:hypothetical protein [Planctomycetaceae bacterium]
IYCFAMPYPKSAEEFAWLRFECSRFSRRVAYFPSLPPRRVCNRGTGGATCVVRRIRIVSPNWLL